MTWEDVLKRDDIVGGDIETISGSYVYRGPIASIRIENGVVHIKSPWCAVARRDGSGGWKPWSITDNSFSSSITPSDIGDGRVYYNMAGLASGTIFPKGGSKLDPAKVEGLKRRRKR